MLTGEDDEIMATADANEGKGKKPYVKPVLECATVYEASGATCCKVNNASCSISGRNTLGKTQKLSTVS